MWRKRGALRSARGEVMPKQVVIFQVSDPFWPKKIQEPSLLERFRRLRRAVTEPELESGMERYEPGKFSWGTRG